MDPPPTTPGRGPTIRDVARRARVGVGTVSRVLNGSPRVSEDARQRVRSTIDELGYRRSSAARSLSLGQTQTIGVVAPFFTTGSVAERLRGVLDHLHSRGDYDLMLFGVETAGQRADAFREFARRDRVDGLLVISLSPTEAEVDRLRREGLPVVLIDVSHPAFPHVVIDDRLGGRLATEHLLTRGHRRIGFVGDQPSAFGFTSSELRRKGMRRALRRARLEPIAALEARGPHGLAEARQLTTRLLSRADRPSAIFAASDVQAMGVLEAADALGLRVPADLAVIGFDDLEVSAALGLTTVRQPLRETGARGAELLLHAIERDRHPAGERPEHPVAEMAPLTVMVRRTT